MSPGTQPRVAGFGFAAAVFAAMAALGIAIHWWVHARAGFSFPLPLGDEAAFLWPALSVAEHGTLLAPQLDPDRHILWMTPAYPLVMGAIFALTDFSLEWARALSAGFLTAGFVAFALALRSLRAPFAGLLLLCGVFVGRDFVLSGNLARMEALLVAAFGGAALLLVRGRRIEAVALLAFAPLIHPNALPPAAAAALYGGWGWLRRRGDWRPDRLAGLCLAATAAAWLAYGAYVALHWGDFWHDVGFQLSWKQQPGPFESEFWRSWLATWRVSVGLAGLVALAGGIAVKSPAVRLLLIALPLAILPLTTGEWYYGVLRALIFWLTGVCLIDVAARGAAALALRPRVRIAGVALVLAWLGFVGRASEWLPSPVGYPGSLRVADMTIRAEPSYIDDGDRRAVRAYLTRFAAEAAGGSSPIVVFKPRVDALFFHDLEGQGLRLVHPTLRTVQPDLAILHVTRLIPESNIFYGRSKLIEFTRGLPALRVRDETEEWRVNRSPGPASHGAREAANAVRIPAP